jgi:cytochrome P450
MINEVVGLINQRFEGLKGSGTVVRLDHAFVAFSGDVIGRICCEDHNDMVKHPEFAPYWFDLLHGVIFAIPLFMGFPFIINIVSLIPERLVTWVDSGSRTFVTFKKMARDHIIKAKLAKLEPEAEKGTNAHSSLFHYIVNSDMPKSELSTDRLAKEAQVLLGAGSASTARTLDFMVYYIIADERIRARLGEELRESMSGYPEKIPTWSELEKLPYLQAIIKEGLRLVSLQVGYWTIKF